MICPDCDLVCDSAVAFKYHMRHMHSKHACMHCSKAFANRGAFERHAATHAISANCQPHPRPLLRSWFAVQNPTIPARPHKRKSSA